MTTRRVDPLARSASSALLSKREGLFRAAFIAKLFNDHHPLLIFRASATAYHTPAGRLDRVVLVVGGMEHTNTCALETGRLHSPGRT